MLEAIFMKMSFWERFEINFKNKDTNKEKSSTVLSEESWIWWDLFNIYNKKNH